ncbi:MAG TPA: hypothetical protein VE825_04065, partial [Terriglobales bacterium]|nr:hypothetical protein [Terriglobales bacterium]
MTPRTAFLIVWGSILLGLAALVLLVVAVKKLRAWLLARAAARLGLAVNRAPGPFTMEEAEHNTLLRLFNAEARGPSLCGRIDGIEIVVFHRHFVTKSGFHTATEYADETVAAFRCFPGKEMEFQLGRGAQLRTQQPETTARILTPEKLQLLERLQQRERWTLWAGGEWLLV